MPLIKQLNIAVTKVKEAGIRTANAAHYTDEVFKGLLMKGLAEENHINFHLRAMEAARQAKIIESSMNLLAEKVNCHDDLNVLSKEELDNIEKVIRAIELEANAAELARTSIACAASTSNISKQQKPNKQNRCLIS